MNQAQNIQDIRISLDSIWVVLGGILVFFMQAGFALVESGSVRSKNTVNVLMKNYMDACLGGLVFWIVGFGLMFGVNQTGWFGLSHFIPNELDDWHWNLLFFQMMFAATATTIASACFLFRSHPLHPFPPTALPTGEYRSEPCRHRSPFHPATVLHLMRPKIPAHALPSSGTALILLSPAIS